jgi:formylglycine-generating enzyme required for sulfatase activity
MHNLVFLVTLAALSACSDNPVESEKESAVFRDCDDCPEMMSIPAGSFMMGSTPEQTTAAGVEEKRAVAEWPQHKVEVARGFAIGRYELTIAEFAVYAEETRFAGKGCWTMAAGKWALDADADWRNPGFAVESMSPAVCLTRDEFDGYLAWLSTRTGHRYRLPSEAEWEYVAQLANPGPKIWAANDAQACSVLNGADMRLKQELGVEWAHFECDDGYALTSPGGTFGADQLGLFDLFGNVAEYTSDCFFPNHDGAPSDAAPRTSEKACVPVPVKGGSWAGEPGFFRPAFRVSATAQVRGTGFGVRVLRELDTTQ